MAGALVLNVALNAALIPAWGVVGAAWTAVVGESLLAVALLSFHGSAKDLVNGENAMVVADNDTDAFAATIERLLADAALATRLGEAGRSFAHDTQTWSSAAERIENVYRGLV